MSHYSHDNFDSDDDFDSNDDTLNISEIYNPENDTGPYIPFTIEGVIIYDSTTNKITRKIFNIFLTKPYESTNYNESNDKVFAQTKFLIARRIAKIKDNLKNQDSSQNGGKKGGHGYAKNSTEYKKQKEKLKSNTLRFKKNPHTKTYKK